MGKVGEKISSLFVTDDLLDAYSTFRGLDVVNVSSSDKVENAPSECVAKTVTDVCTTVETVLTLSHDSALTFDEVSYYFLRLREDLTNSLNKKQDLYIVTYVGEQSVEARTVIVVKGVPAKKMGEDETAFFENIAKQFLSGDFDSSLEGNSVAKILTVEVEQQKLAED